MSRAFSCPEISCDGRVQLVKSMTTYAIPIRLIRTSTENKKELSLLRDLPRTKPGVRVAIAGINQKQGSQGWWNVAEQERWRLSSICTSDGVVEPFESAQHFVRRLASRTILSTSALPPERHGKS